MKLLNIKSIVGKTYRKVIHVNGNSAALIILLKVKDEWVNWTTSEYFKFDVFSFDKLPNFITRHVNKDTLQNYINSRESNNFNLYPLGLFFEDKEINYKLTFGKNENKVSSCKTRVRC